MALIVPLICTGVEERPAILYGLSYDPMTNQIDHGHNGVAAIRKYMETWMLEKPSSNPKWLGVGIKKESFEEVKMWILDENEVEGRVVGVLWALGSYRPCGGILPNVEGYILWELQAQYRELA
ncbi:hypothetical protein GGTG_07211 [Gaeumannomyces tritici R3-111a-1]|uniref:Uncharacterized protein n=1 Tax=Gaeumannomyces tritici (strain R3-111a-1) TaxID=644352 RepID=J3P114_GAET3|nr:hypothetical protein GGTG_07211 [Gaeumannomyces tritici R3-111a-1]EJT77299.1 hypothetical protein GGTG_07211 [Gaeumannomyces tritici R3-111a-1]